MKRIVYLFLAAMMTAIVWAVPARKGGVVVTQPDGSEMIIYQHGDEHFHWMTNENGEWIACNADGKYEVVSALSNEEIQVRRAASPRNKVAEKQGASPLNIAPRGLIILVNFSDLAFETSKAEMDSMLMGENYTRDYSYTSRNKTYDIVSEGSARQYFIDASFGQYNPYFDVVGPVTVSQKMSYYGGNNPMGNDKYAEKMVVEACKLVDDSVDFALYDNDNNGVMDFVYVIYAGFGEADGGGANTIWPHQYDVSQYQKLVLDSVKIAKYACSNELEYASKVHAGIGTFCHEFSHVLGLPDLYATNGATHHTCADWDVMDYGPYTNDGNTPPTYSAYERFFMGWLTPKLLVEREIVTVPDLQTTNEAFLISENDMHNLIGNDPDTTVFYMVENRQQTGWDLHLPGHGMLLTKIAYSKSSWKNNTVNDVSTKMGVNIIEAKVNNSSFGKETDAFPAGATSYTKIANHSIKDITEEDGVITFNYKDAVLAGVEDIYVDGDVVAVYNVLGQVVATSDLTLLRHGTYIVKTTQGTKKIIIR